MEQLVPQNHVVRNIDKTIDFEFTRDEVALLYFKDNGRHLFILYACLKSYCLVTSSQ